jgi:hypothetical protein
MNGHLMRDPEMIFVAEESGDEMNLVPFCWRNDYAGIEQYSAFTDEGTVRAFSFAHSISEGRSGRAPRGPLA